MQWNDINAVHGSTFRILTNKTLYTDVVLCGLLNVTVKKLSAPISCFENVGVFKIKHFI
jgi:hypothetical protein